MVLVDTSVWVDIFRDSTGRRRAALSTALEGEEVVLSRFHELEMLQGCRDESEWTLLKGYLDAQDYLELSGESWGEAARIFFDLRRIGRTVRSPIDCCIAQIALDHAILLLHRDRDFETIATVRPLRQARLTWS
jgi:predicted nucleic acid-binding protein